jgi:hypothetical protein
MRRGIAKQPPVALSHPSLIDQNARGKSGLCPVFPPYPCCERRSRLQSRPALGEPAAALLVAKDNGVLP